MKPTKTLTERWLALALSVLLAFSAVPAQALAQIADDANDSQVESVVEASVEDADDVCTEKAEQVAAHNDGESQVGEAATLSEDGADYAVMLAADDTSSTVSATCAVYGVDADGNQEAWAAADTYSLPAGSTAADLSEALFAAKGVDADYGAGSWGWSLNSITHGGTTYAYDATTGRYWQLFVNGKASDYGAGSVTLSEGDSVVWAYSAYGDEAPAEKVSATCEVIGTDASGNQQVWAQPTTVSVTNGATASDLSEQVFSQSGIKADTGTSSWGWYLNSLTSPTDSSVTLSSEQIDDSTWAYWQLFINGEYASVGAGSYTLKAGDAVSWVYGSDGTLPGHVSATVEVIGLDENGKAERWSSESVELLEGSTAADASEAIFAAEGIDADYGTTTWGWSLNSITHNGTTYAYDAATGKYWQLFVNGESSSLMASGVTLKSGDKITWAYAAYDDELPDPDASDDTDRGDDLSAEWPGYGDSGTGSATTTAPTPQDGASAAWTFDYSSYGYSASEPVIANGYVFIASGTKLLKVDYATGKLVAAADLVASVGYTCRPVMVGGYVVIPLSGGRVQAVSAKTMETLWSTEALSDSAQASCTVTADQVDGEWYVNASTVDVDYGSGTYDNGYYVRIKLSDGTLAWTHHEADEGYYWDGSASVGDYLVTSTSAGTLQVLSKSTGDVVSSVKLGALVNSDPVVCSDGSTVYVLSRDGRLHVVALGEDGKLGGDKVVETGLTGCACAPTLVGGKLIVGGETSDSSALAVIDLSTLETQLVTSADGSAIPAGFGGIKGVPLVSEQSDGTYVYFTVNAAETTDYVNYTSGGGVYRYKLGDAEATLIYDTSGHNQYCDSPVICDKDGNLYYINDSGTLFKLSGSKKNPVPTPDPDPDPEPTPDPDPTPNPDPEPGKKNHGNGGGSTTNDDTTNDESSDGLAGNGSATQISLTSNVTASVDVTASDGEKEVADSVASTEGTASETTSSDNGTTTKTVTKDSAESVSTDSAASSSMPIWPFVGIGAGLLALILVLVGWTRKKDEE